MNEVDAIYQNGVFKPLTEPGLSENQRVRLRVQPMDVRDIRAWLTAVQERQQKIISRCGHFPDSTLDIAEDRRR